MLDNEYVPVLVNNKPNCVAANAAMLRLIRYKIDNRKQKENYTSYIGIFPLCCIDNVLNGYRAAVKFYNLKLPTFFIFTGKSCF
jgi:CRISPR/Cas system CMR-associated protein Cmr5 small subunit